MISTWLADPENLTRLVVWAGALCTLGIYTFLYRENVIYRAFEHLYLGLAIGYGIHITISQVLIPQWWEPMWKGGQWWWAFALVIGSMFYFIYSQKHNWISRVAFGALMGLSVGFMFQEFAGTNFPKIAASLKPIIPRAADAAAQTQAVTISQAANNLIFLVVLLAVMSYFFFCFDYSKNKNAGKFSQLGRWMLMFAFGAMFGATVMARMSLLIGRMWFLLHNWLGLAKL